ncbi:hypothetical protein Tco_0822255 [Tanacetum coccineum]|uniref:Uncharacterized protein n=1 Tax=Tanacetum coccineum TaxID=301880 RepID=A0ABQ5AEH9_9ASTR
MAAPGTANMVARRVTDDLIAFIGETAPPRYMKFFLTQKLAESQLQAMANQDEEHNSLLATKDAKHSEQSKLVALNDVIAEALEEIETQEANVEILDGGNDGISVTKLKVVRYHVDAQMNMRCWKWGTWGLFRSCAAEYGICHAQFVRVYTYVIVVIYVEELQNSGSFILMTLIVMSSKFPLGRLKAPKFSEVAESPRLADKMKYVFGSSRGEVESFAKLVRDLCFALRILLSKKPRLVAELEALGEREGTAKPFEHMKEIVARDAVTLREFETLLARALVGVSLKAGFVADMEEKA